MIEYLKNSIAPKVAVNKTITCKVDAAELIKLIATYCEKSRLNLKSQNRGRYSLLYEGIQIDGFKELISRVKGDARKKEFYEAFQAKVDIQLLEKEISIKFYERFILGTKKEKDLYSLVLNDRLNNFSNYLRNQLKQ